MIRIIVVEDDEGQRRAYESTINSYNREFRDEPEYEIKAKILKNGNDVPNIIFEQRVDAIIMDLDWGTIDTKTAGNEMVKHLYDTHTIPLFIISGNLAAFDSPGEETPFFKTYSRDTSFYDVLLEIKSLYETGYTKAVGTKSLLTDLLQKTFWEHLAPTLDSWNCIDDEHRTHRLLRYTLTRIGEMLGQKEVEGEYSLDEFNAREVYIIPPIYTDQNISGDIFEYDGSLYILLTPNCDLIQKKADHLLLAKIDTLTIEKLLEPIKLLNSETPLSGTQQAKWRPYINNSKDRYHLLPPCMIFDGGLIDFQNTKSILVQDICSYNKVAGIHREFMKDIQSRYASYYARQGQPQISLDGIVDEFRGRE